MCLESLVLREDPSTFGVLDPCKYFEKFMKSIGIDIALDLFFSSQLAKNKSRTIPIPINFINFSKYLSGSRTPKVDGSSLNAKLSRHMVSGYFQYTKMPKVGQGNTSYRQAAWFKEDQVCGWCLRPSSLSFSGNSQLFDTCC